MGSDTIITVRDAQGGDSDAWRKLIRKVREVVTRRLDLRDLPPFHDVDDMVQVVLHDVVRSLHDFDAADDGASFRGWVAVILKRRLVDLWRRAHSAKRKVTEEALFGDYDEAAAEPEDDRWVRQSVLCRGRETEDCVRRQLAKLADADRHLLDLREDKGLAFDQIAEALGEHSVTTVRVRYHRACARREDLVRECFRDSDATGEGAFR